MKARRSTNVIASPELLRAAISDADANRLIGPAFRRATLVADAEAIELGELFASIGFTAADFDHFVEVFRADNPAAAIAAWADHETRPRVLRALAVALITIEEER
ncbi:hypothetical protein ABH930_006370 [Kitasatospora sp. GAS204A]|uniref:hypothetical protein n=1 Tax=unclassified Kitasatospora TaxID=2633591 RepID=UPI002473A700|nr:hypothetical protein [Kitasatospora sp. GAS204B]MDH6122038.1 hypothetical protein [Kitasatospora sp. GAS204B]